jgi:hypothetical protein
MFITCHSIKIQDKRDYLKQKDLGHKYHQTRHSTEWREKKIKYFGLSEESHQNSGHSLSIVAMDRRATSRPRLKSISLILRGKGRAPPWELPRWFS